MAVRPEVIQFEPNTTCNLRCRVCPCTSSAGSRPSVNVTFQEYREIFGRSFTPPYLVIYSGFSEALLNPNLYRMVEYEKYRHCSAFVATNGVLLDDRRVARFLDAGVDQFVVSLDSDRPEIYEAVRTGARLPAVLRNVLRLRDEIARRASPSRIVVNCVVLRDTSAHLESLLRFLDANGIADVALIKGMKMAGMRNRFLREQYLSWEDYNALPLRRVAQRARTLGMRLMRSDDAVLRTRGCHCPGGGFYISAGFDVAVCPFLSFHPRYVFGNLRRESIDEILRKDAFVAFRERFARGKWPAVCNECACLFSELERP